MTRVESTALVIPVEGELHRIVAQRPSNGDPDSLVWATGILAEHGGGHGEVQVSLTNIDSREGVGIAVTTVDFEGVLNPRAQAAVVHLTGGVHFAFRGPVLLAGLTRDSADEIEKLIGTT